MAAKVHRQPTWAEIVRIKMGATRAPTLVPLVKIPFPIGRSPGGSSRDTTRSAAGQFADSVTPSNKRNSTSPANPPANPVKAQDADHATTAHP